MRTGHGVMIAALGAVAACSGAALDAASDTSAIQTALADATSDPATAVQCFTAFKSCVDAAATDDTARAACEATLKGCLPDRPDRPPLAGDGGAALCGPSDRPHHGPDGDGDGPGGHGPPPGARPDGGLPPQPHEMGPEGPHHCGFGGPAAQACKTALDACLADSANTAQSCADKAHACVHDAVAANFQAECAHRVGRCRSCGVAAEKCDALAALCAAGVLLADRP